MILDRERPLELIWSPPSWRDDPELRRLAPLFQDFERRLAAARRAGSPYPPPPKIPLGASAVCVLCPGERCPGCPVIAEFEREHPPPPPSFLTRLWRREESDA